ncbi:MAG: hypothetical protein H7249_12805 [Chitinophagaceae bacterium]|nr:hypothetical protein [Oligoflexus sp.]
MEAMKITESERWLLSFYRVSEINGAQFFGRLAKNMKDKKIQYDLTKHFADESQHAWLWTKCLGDLNMDPINVMESYQDQYVAAVGLPTNMMEVLAITQVFERRVIGQYGVHRGLKDINPYVAATLDLIMEDEKWHIEWITQSLKEMETKFTKEVVISTLKKYHEADQAVYEKTLKEHGEHLKELMDKKAFKAW